MWYCTIWYIKFWLCCIGSVDDALILFKCYYWYVFISDIAESEDWKQVDDSEAGAERLKPADIEGVEYIIYLRYFAIVFNN